MIEIRNVSKYFFIGWKFRKILDHINLTIERGEVVALTGRSGEGKSTLLNIISGLIRPTSGHVRFGRFRLFYLFDIMPSFMRNHSVGFIFQTFRLLSHRSAYENILLPARISGWIGLKKRRRAEYLMKELGIEEIKRSKAGYLSGGQKQRVAIARALINDPFFILADEPTANLDKETSTDIYQILETLAKEKNKAVLIVTHQDFIFEKADRILKLENGQLINVTAEYRKSENLHKEAVHAENPTDH